MERKAHRTLVLGASESGKSHWAKTLVDKLPMRHPILIWDPNGEWAGINADRPVAGGRGYSSTAALIAALKGGAVVTRAAVQSGERDDFLPFLRLAEKAGNLTLALDELHSFVTAHDLGTKEPGKTLLRLLRHRRHHRCNFIAISQRPHTIPVDLREADTYALFRMRGSSALRWMRDELDPALADRVQQLKPREFIIYP